MSSDFSLFSLFTAGLACLVPLANAYTQPVGDSPSGNPISQPGLNSVVPAGEDFVVTWNPTTQGTVTLVLLKGPASNLQVVYPIAEKIDNSGSYTWSVADDLTAGPTLATGYGIQLIVDATGQYQYTTQFGISNDDDNNNNDGSWSHSSWGPGGWGSSSWGSSTWSTSASTSTSVPPYPTGTGSWSGVATGTASIASSSPSSARATSSWASTLQATTTSTAVVTASTAAASTSAKATTSASASATSATPTGGAANLATGFGGLFVAAGVAMFAI